MINFIRQRIYIEFDDILEYEKYLKRYLEKGYAFIQSGVHGERFYFEVEKYE